MALNKAQINHFCEKARIVRKRVRESHENAFLPQPELSVGQKAAKVANGEARFRIEYFEEKACPRISSDPSRALSHLFEIPGEDEIEAQNNRRIEILQQVIKRIDGYTERLQDDFAIGEIDDPRYALRLFEELDFFTPSERKTLQSIAVSNSGQAE